MSFTSIDLQGSPVTMLVSRPSGSPLTSPPNSPISQCFGVHSGSGAPYFDAYPDPGEAATLGYDGSRGVFFLIPPSTAPDPHLLMLRREVRAASRPATPGPGPVAEPDVRRGQQERDRRAEARERAATLNVAAGITAREMREHRTPETLAVDHASRAQRAVTRPAAESAPAWKAPDVTAAAVARATREQTRQPVTLAVAASQSRRGTPTVVDQAAGRRARRARARKRQPVTLDQHEQLAAQHARQQARSHLTGRTP